MLYVLLEVVLPVVLKLLFCDFELNLLRSEVEAHQSLNFLAVKNLIINLEFSLVVHDLALKNEIIRADLIIKVFLIILIDVLNLLTDRVNFTLLPDIKWLVFIWHIFNISIQELPLLKYFLFNLFNFFWKI